MSDSTNAKAFSSKLSADAPVFTPGTQDIGTIEKVVGGVPLTEVPGYITSCFPFVQPDVQAARLAGKWNGRGRGSGRIYSGRGGKSRRGMIPVTSSMWGSGTYAPQVQAIPGMTFDGGTVLAQGDGLLPTPIYPTGCIQPVNGYSNNYTIFGISSIQQASIGNSQWSRAFLNNTQLNMVDTMTNPESGAVESTWMQENARLYKSPYEDPKTKTRSHTLICKDMSVQTDFSDDLAAQTLSQKANTLYVCSHVRRRRDKTKTCATTTYTSDSEVDSDSGYSSPLHRRNVRSNGTDPVGSTLLMPSSSPDRGRSVLGRSHSNQAEPTQQHITYASIAQQKNTVSRAAVSYSAVAAGSHVGTPICDTTVVSVQSDGSNSVIQAVSDYQDHGGESATEGGKRRRRRRNRRKKKLQEDGGQSDGLSATGRTFSSSNVSRTSDITLHFEDDGEFPDLYQSNVESGHDRENDLISRQVSISYSQILKSSPSSHVSRCSSRQSDDFDLSREQSCDDNTDSKQETKSARKRRKRRELANQAAEVELAEIGLEQQMLKELSLKPKQGAAVEEGSSKSQKTSKQLPAEPMIFSDAKKAEKGKKSKQPITFDILAMITALEKKKDEPQPVKKHIVKKTEEKVIANTLDSSAPAKRGKERETPKAKKPSPLKKVILKEREEKKKMRLLDDDPRQTGIHITEAPVGVGVANADSDLSQDAMSSKSSMEMGNGVSTSADLSPISQTSPISMSPLSPGASPLSSGVNSPITGTKEAALATLKIHSRRFREYCNQVLDKDIDTCCMEFLQDLVRFQDRMFHKDPIKAKARRRLVLGLREVTKHLKLKKIKCVIISPNMEKIQSKGGLDDALNTILNMCQEQNIPFVFALGRRALGRACAKLVPVSCAGVFNYDGCEETFKKMMTYTEKARQAYNDMVLCLEKEMEDCPTRVATSIYAHMGHSRTPSGCSVMSFTSSILSEPISENYPHSEPETDNRGYEIVKEPQNSLRTAEIHRELKITHGNFQTPVDEIDDGNEADTEDCSEAPAKTVVGVESIDNADNDEEDDDAENSENDNISEENSEDDSDTETSDHASDTVNELPHIDSIHSVNYDPSLDILSQHSGRTLDRSEAMSTHSSRTIGDGSSTIMTDMIGADRVTKADVTHSVESPSESAGTHVRPVKFNDKDRIQIWVDASNNNLSGVEESSEAELHHSKNIESENETDRVLVKGVTEKS